MMSLVLPFGLSRPLQLGGEYSLHNIQCNSLQLTYLPYLLVFGNTRLGFQLY